MVNEKKKPENRAKSRRAGAKKNGKVCNCGKKQWKEVWNKMNIQEQIV